MTEAQQLPPKKRGRKPGSLSRFKCCDCGAIDLVSGGSGNHRCKPCRIEFMNSSRRATRKRAESLVSAAVKAGVFAPARVHKCVDCGEQARDYDHRDYQKPLTVEPVCRSCNLRRGPARQSAVSLRAQVAGGCSPYRMKARAAKLLAVMGASDCVLREMPARLDLSHWRRIVDTLPEGA